MVAASLELRPADESDLSYVESLLEANGLPSADVRSKPGCFYVGYADAERVGRASDERAGVGGVDGVGFDGDERAGGGVERAAAEPGDPVGIGGIERFGADGLLRSVVVEESARGEGRGTALCSALESRARSEGVETLYLLTTTAAAFFADRGFEEIERSNAPAAIRESREFADLCPTTAVCMRKSLSSR